LTETEFDRHADSYRAAVEESIGFSGMELDYFARRKANLLLDLARRRLGDPGKLTWLDVGCGIGLTDGFLTGHVGRLLGVDTSREAIDRALKSNPEVAYTAYDGDRLPYGDAAADLAFAICVFHHVPVEERPGLARELRRVVRPGGLVVVIEHNPLNPLTRLAVSRCEFDADAVLLTRRRARRMLAEVGLQQVEARYVVFSTSGSRRLERAERALGWLPAGAQHYVAAERAA
jgi:SAM-dependent methyltransferase